MNVLSSDRYITCLESTTLALENTNFENQHDFKIVKTALKCILNNEDLPNTLPEKMSAQLHFLKNVIDQPSNFIGTPELCDEFIPRLKKSIIAKREEIKNFTAEQKELKIRKCQHFQDKVNTYCTMSEEIFQNQLKKLNEFYHEIIKSFTAYLTDFTLALSSASGDTVSYKFIPRINFLLMNKNKFESLDGFKNKRYELPHISNGSKLNPVMVEEVISKHLDDLAEIGIIGTLILVEETFTGINAY